jgi:sugar-specific transcriptional regulator TrmB
MVLFGSSEETNPRSEVIRWFISLGMTPLQAQVFVILARHKGADADFIEEQSGANADSVRKALSQMEQRELVRRKREQGAAFYAVEPELLVEKLVRAKEAELEEARENGHSLLIWLSGLKPADFDDSYNPRIFKLLYGPDIFSMMLALTKNARTEILRVASPAGLQVNMRLGLFEAERSSLKRGVKVKAVVFRDKLLKRVIESYMGIADVRLTRPSPEIPRLTIIDGTALLFTSLPTTSPKKHAALWTTNRMTVGGLKHAFEDLWNSLPSDHTDRSL